MKPVQSSDEDCMGVQWRSFVVAIKSLSPWH